MADKDETKLPGAKARAAALTPERRREIAQRAAAKRWGPARREAISLEGVLSIGGVELQCYVLDDETRVFSRASFVRAIGRTGKVKGGRRFDGELQTPVFLTANNLKPFFPKDLDRNSTPILFTYRGQDMIGYRAELLPDVCDTFLDAERDGKLKSNQLHIAAACRILSRGLTRVGIIGLVDEATGYQKVRARDELQKILGAYIAKELLPWAKRFPDSFYEELHRVRGWRYEPGGNARNAYIGKLTNTLIYEQLPQGVLDELKAKNPVDPTTKRRKHLHHQLLTQTVGHPHLEKQIVAVTTLLRVSDTWEDFTRHFSRMFPPGPGDLFALPPPA